MAVFVVYQEKRKKARLLDILFIESDQVMFHSIASRRAPRGYPNLAID